MIYFSRILLITLTVICIANLSRACLNFTDSLSQGVAINNDKDSQYSLLNYDTIPAQRNKEINIDSTGKGNQDSIKKLLRGVVDNKGSGKKNLLPKIF